MLPQLIDLVIIQPQVRKVPHVDQVKVSNDRDQPLSDDVACSQWANDYDYHYMTHYYVTNGTSSHDPTIHVPYRLIMRSIVTETKSRIPTLCGTHLYACSVIVP